MQGSSLENARRQYVRPAYTVLFAAVASAAVFVLVEAFRPFLYYVFPVNVYLTIHTLLEFSSVIVSFAVFIVNWQAYSQNRGLYALFIATGFLSVGLFDLMHLLSYNGMPEFVTANSPEKAIDYWLAGRIWAVTILLSSVSALPGRRAWFAAKPLLLTINLGVAAAAFIIVSFFHQVLPPTFIEGQGLTPLKIGLEYGVIGLTVIAIVAYSVLYRRHEGTTSVLILSALVVSVFSELAFTLYTNVYDTYNLLGHVYKVVAYYLIFRALLVTSVIRPYKELRQANEDLAGTLEQLNQRARELGILNEVAATVSKSLDLEQMLSSTLDRVLGLLHVEAGRIMLVRQGSDELTPLAWRGIPKAVVDDTRSNPLKLGEGVAGLVAATETAVVGDDLSKDQRVARAVLRDAGLKGFAVVPIKSKGVILGTLLVATRGARRFSPSDVQLLEAIGNQLGLAVENARLYERTDEQLQKKVTELAGAEQRSRLLSEISALLNSSLDLPTTLSQLGKTVAETLGDFVVIALRGNSERLSVPFAFHKNPAKQRLAEREFAERPFALSEGVIGHVVATGQPAFAPEASTEVFSPFISPEREAFYDEMGFVSHIAVPLEVGGNIVGAMSVGITESARHFSEADFELLKEIGRRAAVSIHNDRLYAEVQAERSRLQAIIDQLPEGVVIAGAPLGSSVVANRVAHAIGGYAWVRGRLAGGGEDGGTRICKTSGETCGEEELPSYRALCRGEVVRGEQMIVKLVGAESVTVLVNAAPVVDEAGIVTGAVVVFQDISEIKNLERVKDEFISIASHDIKSPVTSIKGYAQLALRRLEKKQDISRLRDHLAAIDKQADVVTKLVETLLDVSRIQLGGLRLSVEPVDLASLVRETVDGARAADPNHRFGTSVVGAQRAGRWDRGRLQQVVSNLLGNAGKYSPEDSEISAEVFFTDVSVAVSVRDEGIGIPEPEQKHVFERFYRTSAVAKGDVGGTGLGLYISKGIIEAHGGKIWVESKEGQGSKFCFELPYEVPRAAGEFQRV